jgi:hypothetical protein
MTLYNALRRVYLGHGGTLKLCSLVGGRGRFFCARVWEEIDVTSNSALKIQESSKYFLLGSFDGQYEIPNKPPDRFGIEESRE